MPDITLCASNVKSECPLAPFCYRATATPNEVWQSWTAEGRPGVKCHLFMPNEMCKGPGGTKSPGSEED
jgi:hypothetical protein